MPKVNIVSMDGKNVGSMELSETIFGQEMNQHVVYQVVRAQLANARQGTQSALTRAEVSGGGRKPWRQKGTGRARQGSTRSPQWKHGGIVFAPKPRSYRISVPRKVKQLALRCALSDKVTLDEMVVLDSLTLKESKTREMVAVLKNLEATKKVVLVLPSPNESVSRAANNLPYVKILYVNTLNVVDVLGCDKFVVLKDAIPMIEEVYTNEKSS